MIMLFVASIHSSQNNVPRHSFNQNETRYLKEQIIKLQSLHLPSIEEEDEQLLINCTKETDGLISIKIFVGTFSRENNIVRYNELYEQHDESKKICYNIVQFLINQPEAHALHSMTDHLNIGQTSWTFILFEDSTDS